MHFLHGQWGDITSRFYRAAHDHGMIFKANEITPSRYFQEVRPDTNNFQNLKRNMISATLRSALRANVPRTVARSARPSFAMSPLKMTSVRMYSEHHEETFEEFTARYVPKI